MPVDDRWSKLSMRDRADLIKIYTKHGITDLNEIRRHYNSFQDPVFEDRSKPKADLYNRLVDEKDNRSIKIGDGVGTHLMSWATVDDKPVGYSQIQPDNNGNLKDYGDRALDRAIERGDTIQFRDEKDADWWTSNNYKQFYKKMAPTYDEYRREKLKEKHPFYNTEVMNTKANGGYLNSDNDNNDSIVIYKRKPFDNYRKWKKKMLEYNNIDVNNDEDYNYKKFYKDNKDSAWSMLNGDSNVTFPELYKYPTHPTFSSQSMYSYQWKKEHGKRTHKNDKLGGNWGSDDDGIIFFHSPYTARDENSIKKTAEYIKAHNPDTRAIFEPISITPMLKEVTINNYKKQYPDASEKDVRAFEHSIYIPKTMIDYENHLQNLKELNDSYFNKWTDEDVYNMFNNNIWYLENEAKEGYDKKNKVWKIHESPEGGTPTIGGGIKFDDNNKKWKKIYDKQGYLTEKQLDDAMKENATRAFNNAKKTYIKAYGKKEWNSLHPMLRSMLMDISYNVGDVGKFPILLKAIHNKDLKQIKEHHHRSYKKNGSDEDIPLTRRNDFFDNLIETTENLFD